jgi:DMSO reductase family type II enzyme heme b subunit
MDRYAASRATAVAAAVVALLVVVQTGVGAAVTAGRQPMAVREQVPTTSTAAAWDEAPSRTVSLSAQQMALPHGGGSVDEMRIKAVTNATHVAIRLTWTDPTRDTNISMPRAYSDAVAVMLKGGQQPPITMGATGTPVDIWYWRANWQFGNHTGTGSWTGDMYAYPHPNDETKPGLAAGNPLSKTEYRRYAQNYYAKGYGSLSHAPVQNVNAHGTRTEDGWQVTFVRERTTEGTYDAAFGEAEQMYLTVAAWNGSADEANGQKSLSYQFLTLDTKSGELAAVESGGSDGAAGADAGDGSGSRSSTDGLPAEFWNGLGGVLAAMIVSWLIAYRSLRDRGEDQ